MPSSTPPPPTTAHLASAPSPAPADDPLIWLEQVDDARALSWVRARNAETQSWAKGAAFDRQLGRLREVLDARDKIPFVRKRGPLFYNVWRDEAHPRGLWRRTTFDAYSRDPVDWEVVLDLDALGRAEGKSWVFAQASYLEPDCRHCMLALSPGGSDARVQREFDTTTKAFVKGGFVLPEAKSEVAWLDGDTLIVGSDFGPGTLTTSGYPRTLRRWRRNTRLADAPEIFAGKDSDVSVGVFHDATPGFTRTFLSRSPSFFTSETFWIDDAGLPIKLQIPDDARHWVHREWLLVQLRTPWAPAGAGGPSFVAGELVVAPFADFMAGSRDFFSLFRPGERASLEGVTPLRDHIVMNVLEDVKNRLEVAHWRPQARAWQRGPLAGAPTAKTLSVGAVDPQSNALFFTVEDHLTPTSLWYAEVDRKPRLLKQTPAFFDASGLAVSQHFATSKDGTQVPYFQVAARDLPSDGQARALLYGYGGFEVSLVPHYSGTTGRGWLADGGVFVVANIRGGGEYGPGWHEQAKKSGRHRAHEDFAAVAQDLVRRRVTRPQRLGIMGGSNGGLLVGNMLTHYPTLFAAAVCQVPLLDMRRYTHLLAGASWIDEYGDADDPKVWSYLRQYSPYHNLEPGVAYPPTLFLTSTRDDRVHPGHARKMMEKMRQMGSPVHYFENIEGGHGGAADNAQAAYMLTLAYTFLRQQLGADP